MDGHCFAILLVPVSQSVFQALAPFQFHRVVEVSGLLGNSVPGGASSGAAGPRASSCGSPRLRLYSSHDSMPCFFHILVRKESSRWFPKDLGSFVSHTLTMCLSMSAIITDSTFDTFREEVGAVLAEAGQDPPEEDETSQKCRRAGMAPGRARGRSGLEQIHRPYPGRT